ncbi:EboA domain-containing protein [Kitasatospora sp. NPDC097691]|uniref:EboA domain-containing protein n=1 Tax=Kitasatospora sp. NPDC097691 TaxID=3157231 RepID=UPI00331952D9
MTEPEWSTTRLREALADRLTPQADEWLRGRLASAAAGPDTVRTAFPGAARHGGRGDLLPPGRDREAEHPLARWQVEDAVRTLLLAALPLRGEALVAELTALYRGGDTAERRAVLRALSVLDHRTTDEQLPGAGPYGLGDGALPLVRDALRTNDLRLIAAALGDYAARRLDQAAWRQAVLKCVFTGIPLALVAGLADRTDTGLLRMLDDFATERRAAGRAVPADIESVLHAHRVP